MSSKRGTTFVSFVTRSPWQVSFVCLLALSFSLLVGAPAGNNGNRQVRATGGQGDQRPPGMTEAELRFLETTQREYYSRPDWTSSEETEAIGRHFEVDLVSLDDPTVIVLPHDKGNMRTLKAGRRNTRDYIPSQLRANEADLQGPAKGKKLYYIVQMNPAGIRGKGSLEVRKMIADRGGEVMQYLHNNGFVVRVEPQSRKNFTEAGLFQYFEPIHPSDKIHHALGRGPLADPVAAVSDEFDLVVELWPGEDTDRVQKEMERLGAEIVGRSSSEMGTMISGRLHNSRVFELSRLPEVKLLREAARYEALNLTTSAQVEVGRFLDNREFGNFVLPYRDAGVDGGGLYTGPAVNFTVPGTQGAPIAYSSALGNFAVAPQFLGIADNGLTMDTTSFSHDNANPCAGTGTCGSAGQTMANTGVSHRKVEAYMLGTVTGDGTSTGDFLTCDSIQSGGNSHGTIVAGGAAANPSDGQTGLGRKYEDQDAVDVFVVFFNDSHEVNYSLDGQARGARVIFQDIALTPASSPPACSINFLSDVDAGDDPSQRLRDMAFRRDLAPGATALDPRGAKVTLFAFGNPTNFDDNITNGQGNYTLGADDVDAFLLNNRRVLHVQPVGNDGGNPLQNGANIDPFAPTDPNDTFTADDIQINDLATGKNPLTVGSTIVDDARASTDQSEFPAQYTSKGPSTFNSLRIAPLVMAPGVDVDGGFGGREGRFSDTFGISLQVIVSETNSQAGPVSNSMVQARSGTSVSAGKVAGAALQVRDYFAKGFYPTGAAVVGDRRPDVSGMLVKAVLANSADFNSQGPPIASCPGRFCVQSGYGEVELSNTLPITTYRTTRRPANRTNILPETSTSHNLLVADEYLDGGLRGTHTVDGSATGLGVVAVGGSVSFDFIRRHGDEQLRATLAWYDHATSELLQNDLDLEIISGDYDFGLGTAGGGTGAMGAGQCGPGGAGSRCSSCRWSLVDDVDADPNNGSTGTGAWFDPTANNPFAIVWRGNQFRQFTNQFSLQSACTPAGAVSGDTVTFPQNAFDSRNTTEQVVLSYFGTSTAAVGSTSVRGGGDNGYYRARVRFKNNLSATAVPNAPVIAAGPNAALNTAPGGDDTVLTTGNGAGTSYIGAGPNGIANTTAAGDDVQLIPLNSFGQPFALAIAGPVGHPRAGSVVGFNREIYDCSESTLQLRVIDSSVIPANFMQSEKKSIISTRTTIEVRDPNGVVRDTEGALTFRTDWETQPLLPFGFPNPCAVSAQTCSQRYASRGNHYTSDPRKVQFIGNRPGAPNPIAGNRIIEVRDGWTLRAVYDDQSPTVVGGPAPDDGVGVAKVNCQSFLGPVFINVGGGGFGEPLRRTNIAGGCDVGRGNAVFAGVVQRGDLSFDAGESVNYQVGFANQHKDNAINLKATLTCTDPVPGGANPCASITVVQPTVELGMVPPGREGIASWVVTTDQNVKLLATADRAVDMQVSFQSRSSDWGGVLETQTFKFREALQSDVEKLLYNTDFPSGGTQAADINRDGIITTVTAGSDQRNRELQTYKPLNDPGICGVPTPGRCSNRSATCTVNADCQNPNTAVAAMMPWHFDTGPVCANDAACTAGGRIVDPDPISAGNLCIAGQCRGGGFAAFRAGDSKPGSTPQNSLSWFYGTGGGCGWQSQNNGDVGLSATLPKGVWHAGHGPVGTGLPLTCPKYEPPTDAQTADLVEFVHDILRSPELRKVNPAADARGIPFDIRMEAVGMNSEERYGDSFSFSNLDLDDNLDDTQGTMLGDSYSYRLPFGVGGLTPILTPQQGARTFGPPRDSDGSLSGGIAAINGDEVGISGQGVITNREAVILERPLIAYPVADTDANQRGFQSSTGFDVPSGLPIIPGTCTGGDGVPGAPNPGDCTAGADALVGGIDNCSLNTDCTGPGTRIGHSTPWGPVRGRDVDLPAGRFAEFRGSPGDRFQFELNWFMNEGGDGGEFNGWTVDDVFFEWSERHPKDQDPNGANDCANIPNRPGANPAARQCGTLSFERLTLHNCTTGMKAIVTDATPAPTPVGACTDVDPGPATNLRCTAGLNSRRNDTCTVAADCTCPAGNITINARQPTFEPLGEDFCLPPVSPGVFSGTIPISAIADQPGTLFTFAAPGENFTIQASYADPECDIDSDGQVGENDFLDIDGDGILNFGADNALRDVSTSDFIQLTPTTLGGSSDDDNCGNVYNPAGLAQRDNNAGGTISSEDCPAVGLPNGRSPRNGQCDWDDDGFGDLCDNCPLTANNNQLDTDGDGVGNVCEVVDIDLDGDINAADNCPTLYNPSQDDVFCSAPVDVDNDGVFEVDDNCPNSPTPLEGGVPRPPLDDTYNPDQTDNDGDGIGDKCDMEDFDGDGVPNPIDNCKTFYNPADPTFRIQGDCDLDGRGDDRCNRDHIPGPANYCDPDSADDDANLVAGVPDDLVGAQSEINCNFTAFGISNPPGPVNAVGGFAISQIIMTDDGTADFHCTAGDPDPNNNPLIPQACPQETPASPNNDAFCNNPGQPGTGVCSPVPDGVADPGELANLRLGVVNASTSLQTGAPRPLTGLVLGVRGTTPAVGCTPRGQVFIGNLAGGAEVVTPSAALSFIADPANPGPARSTTQRLAEAGFALTAQADAMDGYNPEQAFLLFVDIDRTDRFLAPAACPQKPGINGPGVLCEDFDSTTRNGVAGMQFTRLPLSAQPGDTLRANGDPNDDVLGFTISTGPSPFGTNGLVCPGDGGFPACATPVAEENDWHLHATDMDPDGTHPDQGGRYDPLDDFTDSAPGGPKAHSGTRSMHWGRHLDPLSTLGDTLRFRQVSAFVLDNDGRYIPVGTCSAGTCTNTPTPCLVNSDCPAIPGMVIGPSSTLEFWHMMSIPDDENFGSGFVSPGTSFGGGQVQISLLGFNNQFERWQRLTPSFNAFDSTVQGTVSLCAFDPGDDQILPANLTMCDPAPVWVDFGDIFGTDETCLSDTDNNDPQHNDCGAISCAPGPGCTEDGSAGQGVWARSAFNLSPFAGRIARLRWIGMHDGGWSFGDSRSALEPSSGPAYQYYEGDDGWYIDDIVLTDLRLQQAKFTPDVDPFDPQPNPDLKVRVTGLQQCTTGKNTVNCGTVRADINGADVDPNDLTTGVIIAGPLGTLVGLDARTSTSGDDPGTPGVVEGSCENGVLEARWTDLGPNGVLGGGDDEVLSEFSPAQKVEVAPIVDTIYQLDLRCSSDLACVASQKVKVDVYSGTEVFPAPGDGSVPPHLVTANDTWNPAGLAVFTGGACPGPGCCNGNLPPPWNPGAKVACPAFHAGYGGPVGSTQTILDWAIVAPAPPVFPPYSIWRYSSGTAMGVNLTPDNAAIPTAAGLPDDLLDGTFLGPCLTAPPIAGTTILAGSLAAAGLAFPLPGAGLAASQLVDTAIPALGTAFMYQVAVNLPGTEGVPVSPDFQPAGGNMLVGTSVDHLEDRHGAGKDPVTGALAPGTCP